MNLGSFKIKRRRTSAAAVLFGKSQKLKDEKELPPFFIRGIQAGSKEEYWISLALERIEKAEGFRWEYQVPIYGGRTRSGGLVIDFIVYVPGRPIWLSPMGRYWHTGHKEDRFDEIAAAREKNAELVAFFTDEIPTKEITYTFIRNALRV